MKKGPAHAEASEMTPAHPGAMRILEQWAEDLRVEMDLDRADIQLGNNYTVLHTRTGSKNWLEPERRRILWRLRLMQDGVRRRIPNVNQWRDGVHLSDIHRIKLEY